ncbi:MAG: four helix bundle protein [Candidatus Saccharibacteria bacterium]|nr:four helix bundle protein [Candidatus Saccharibacteria bacterium]
MRIRNFEDVIAWQKGEELYIGLSKELKYERDLSFKDQIMRACLSITNNIAEGFDRSSDKELRQFLVIARGSCAEVRSMLHIALAANKIHQNEYKQFTGISIEISKLLTGFIGKLATSDKRRETKRD